MREMQVHRLMRSGVSTNGADLIFATDPLATKRLNSPQIAELPQHMPRAGFSLSNSF